MNTRTKILFIITKSNYGGAQRYVYDLATHLDPSRYDVMVAAGRGSSGVMGGLAKKLGERQIPITEIRSLARDVHILSDIRAFFELVGLLREEKPHVVHLNSSKAAGIGALAARVVGIPRIVFTIHGLPSDEKRPRYQRLLIAFTTWLTALLSHRVITISSDAFGRVRTMPLLSRKTVCIFNGITPIEALSRSEAREALRAQDRAIPDGFLVGSIGESHPNKRFDRALDAIAQTDFSFVLIGDGETRDALLAHARALGIADRVHMLGNIPDAGRYLPAFDAFLLTSEKEGLPYVLLEAGSSHVPIVASDLPSIRDVVLPLKTGLLASDTPGFAQALLRLRDASFSQSLTQNMAERIRTTFDFTHMLAETERCYE